MKPPILFRFHPGAHEYVELETGQILPHITGMLRDAGLVDDLWFTEESSLRGQGVHKLTADYDLGALALEGCVSRHRPYLLAHAAAMAILRPEILAVEEPLVHPTYRYGGRPDRIVRIGGAMAVLEIKTTDAAAASHRVQTALQAVLAAAQYDLPPEHWRRYVLYLKPSGKFRLLEHEERVDLTRARDIIQRTCAPVGGRR